MTHIAASRAQNENVLGRYRIVEKLARGGMGAVYLGRTEGAEGFARPVVIKRILPALMDDKEVAQMFVREARILSNLQHPGIVSVLDFGQQGDGAYVMVLEYVHGYQLADWVEFARTERGQIPSDFALTIVIRVLEALHYAHTLTRGDGTVLQIIHRDVSPTNIILTEQGGVKLLDFGIARVSGDDAEFMTERPRVKGKLPYLPLEIFKGDEPSVRSDVYSVGVVLYELLTGSNPFAGKQTADIYDKILSVTPPSVHSCRDDAPEEIDEILARAMNRDLNKRYTSAAEFAQELRQLRRWPEETVLERLASQLRSDFRGGMPQTLGLVPLADRELAWRGSRPPKAIEPADEDQTLASILLPDPSPESATVSATIPPSILEAAGKNPAVSDAPTVPPGAPVPDHADHADSDLVVPVRRSSSALKLALGGLALAILAAVLGVSLWTTFAPGQEVVVVQQQLPSATGSLPKAVEPAPPSPPVEDVPPDMVIDDDPDEPDPPPEVPAKGAAPALKPRPTTAPNARSLTRVFERRQGRVQACFSEHAKVLEGAPKLSIEFVVAQSGRVEQAVVHPPAIGATPLGACLAKVARSTNFGPQQDPISFHIPITAERAR